MSFYKCSINCVRLLRYVPVSANILQSRNIKRWVAPTLRVIKRRRDEIGPQSAHPRNTYLEWNYDAELFAFGKRLGEEFDESLLRQAFTHRSFVLKQDTGELKDNSNLIEEGEEFLKNLIDATYSKKYPSDIVNSLLKYLTSEEMLSHVGKHMGVSDIILSEDYPVEIKTLADTFKAIVGALKNSSGDERATVFVNDFLFVQLNGKDVYDIWNPENPYQYLSNLLKRNGVDEIEPRLCNESASNTILANYQVGLYNNKQLLGIGWGETIDIAKETAALNAIQRIYKNYNTLT